MTFGAKEKAMSKRAVAEREASAANVVVFECGSKAKRAVKKPILARSFALVMLILCPVLLMMGGCTEMPETGATQGSDDDMASALESALNSSKPSIKIADDLYISTPFNVKPERAETVYEVKDARRSYADQGLEDRTSIFEADFKATSDEANIVLKGIVTAICKETDDGWQVREIWPEAETAWPTEAPLSEQNEEAAIQAILDEAIKGCNVIDPNPSSYEMEMTWENPTEPKWASPTAEVMLTRNEPADSSSPAVPTEVRASLKGFENSGWALEEAVAIQSYEEAAAPKKAGEPYGITTEYYRVVLPDEWMDKVEVHYREDCGMDIVHAETQEMLFWLSLNDSSEELYAMGDLGTSLMWRKDGTRGKAVELWASRYSVLYRDELYGGTSALTAEQKEEVLSLTTGAMVGLEDALGIGGVMNLTDEERENVVFVTDRYMRGAIASGIEVF